MYTPETLFNGIMIEEGIPEEVVKELSNLGHNPHIVSGHDRAAFGRGQVISQGSWWKPDNTQVIAQGTKDGRSVFWAGSDPRADGCVAGY